MTSSTYNLTQEIARACEQITANIVALSHIDAKRVQFGLSISKKRGKYGLQAACYPLRFEGGSLTKEEDGKLWEWPVLRVAGAEMLYYLNFYVPRFLNLNRDEKLETLVHELYHISPDFDGTLRRLGKGRHANHGPSMKYYRSLIAPLIVEARSLLDPKEFPFLGLNHRKLEKRHGSVYGTRVKRLRPRIAHQTINVS